MGRPTRQDTYSITVTIGGTDYGIWDKMSGGELDSEETKYKPGNMGPEISLGGSTSVGNVTISRLYDLERDHSAIHAILDAVGTGDVVITKQPLDVNAVPFGSPLVYSGKLKSVQAPEADSTSSDPGMIELEISSAGIIG